MTDRAMPGWAARLASAVPGYTFTSYLVSDGRRSVAAERLRGTTGPFIVITDDEREMCDALGVPGDPA
jgi:hypothetical protein